VELQQTGSESNGLRYLDAERVCCPAGRLSGLKVYTDDAEPLGTVEGVVIDPARGRLAYLVLLSPGFVVNRLYLLAIADGAVLEDEGRTLRVNARKDDVRLLPFQHRSIPALTADDHPAAAHARDAA